MVLPPAPIINAVNPVGSSDRVPKQNKGQQRWRSGKAPEWAGGAPAPLAPGEDGSRQSRKVEEAAVISGGIGAVMHDATDRRLRRLAVGRKREVADAEILEGGDEDERHGRHVEEEEEEEEEVKRDEDDDDDDDESEDGDKQEARRARIRELAKQRRMDEAEDEGQMEDEEVDEEKGESSESWEYETDSDEDAELQLVKPVFVSKTNRATLEERARIEKEEKEEEKFKAQRAEQRKKETRKMVAEELQKEKQAALDRQMRQKREDTDEEGNEEEEYDK
jgi:microfibrillar-associated protein 1